MHALARVLESRRSQGATGKDALMAARSGLATSRPAMIGTLRRVFGAGDLSEHSMRRLGAQYYARRGVATPLIQYLGRWGGPTVLPYIGDAFAEAAASASVSASRRRRRKQRWRSDAALVRNGNDEYSRSGGGVGELFSVNSNNNTNNLDIGVSRGRLDADIFRNGNVSNGSSRRDIGDSLSINKHLSRSTSRPLAPRSWP